MQEADIDPDHPPFSYHEVAATECEGRFVR